jgi:hypothetical protein
MVNSVQDWFDESHRLSDIELSAWKLCLIASFIKVLSTKVNDANHSAILLCRMKVMSRHFRRGY